MKGEWYKVKSVPYEMTFLGFQWLGWWLGIYFLIVPWFAEESLEGVSDGKKLRNFQHEKRTQGN